MRVLVVHYSRSGNTRKACEAIAASLEAAGAEVVSEELVDKTERGGVMGWLGGGRDASRKRPTELEPVSADVGSFDLVVIGTPVWAFTCAPAARTFCQQFADILQRVALVATMGGRGDTGAFEAMEQCCGKPPVATLALIDKAIKSGDAEQFTAAIAAFTGKVLAAV